MYTSEIWNKETLTINFFFNYSNFDRDFTAHGHDFSFAVTNPKKYSATENGGENEKNSGEIVVRRHNSN